ncbi:aminotransferase class I/II-fold pyridoxal phosphate-dependent enzyme [Paenibacillus woosongensis]|uniref:Aminotransferase n=1 Tax=Paenibacillus woosongensis TaxID=307580 RepID=A0AA95L2S3_9BACL|nr:aminotransferase class I/II-fold pyridoxal phosphate-dependent enzyme [Paenibacillus woosongensis]WHX50232.1 aminotransferase class I/II-fold pyridoxal phosphate-dependent enzyme [Paenibacillus woosongensis]
MRNDWINPVVQEIPPSGIRAFVGTADEHVISLAVGEPDFVTPRPVVEACIAALNRGTTGYTPNAGLMELREEIAGYLEARFGLDYGPAHEMFVTVGSSEAVDLALRTILMPGDEVIVPTPSYIAYTPIAQLHGGKVVEVQTSAEEEFKLRARDLRRHLTPRSKVLILNYPNNPTGAVMTREDLVPIAELAVAHDLIVISDEIYAELSYGQSHVSIASLPGMKERTLVISGFSKAFAMTGWRIGYVCGPAELIAAMLKIHQYTAMCAPVMGQVAAIASLRSGMQEMEEMIRSYDQRRQWFVSALRDIGLPCHAPAGAFYVFPSIAGTGLSSQEFAQRLLKEAGVAAVPGQVFGAGGEGYIRCSYATGMSQLQEAVERIDRFVRLPLRQSS